MSEFLATSVRDSVQCRRNQPEFIRRGITSQENAKVADTYVDADVLVTRLERKLADSLRCENSSFSVSFRVRLTVEAAQDFVHTDCDVAVGRQAKRQPEC